MSMVDLKNTCTRYPSLDGLRAIAAVGIVMMHVLANSNRSLYPEVLNPIVNSFTNFTFLFMIVSAFGMCCGYYDRFKQGQVNLASFYKKRYTRILPFFVFLVMIDIAVNPSWPEVYEGFADLTLAFGLLPNAGISVVGVGWFLGVVFVFYMIFPFFVFLMDNKKRAWLVLLIAALLHSLAVSYFSRSELMVVPVGRWNIVYSFPFFVVGGLIFLYRQNVMQLSDRSKWLPLLLLSLVIVGYYVLPKIQPLSELLVFSALVLYAVLKTEERGLLNNPYVKFISDISMEIYLCHMLFFRVVEKLHVDHFISNGNILFIVTFLLTFAGALAFSLLWKRIVEPRVLHLFKLN